MGGRVRDRRAALTSPTSGCAARRAPAHGRLRGAVERGRDGADAAAALSRSAGAEAADRSAQSAALPEIHQARLVQLGPPANFTAPASGAGITGFDSTNSRKKAKGSAKATESRRLRNAIRRSRPALPPQPIRRLAVPEAARPTPPDAGALLPARPARRRSNSVRSASAPKKRKAHTEPDDPYAPLGVRAGAFTLFPAVELIGGYDTNPGACARRRGRRALYRRAGIAGAVELVAARTQGRSARQLYRLQSRRDADAEPALFQRQGRRPHRRHAATRASISTAACWSPPTIPAARTCRPVSPSCRFSRPLAAAPASAQKFNRLDLSIKGDVERTTYQDFVADRRHHRQQRRPQLQSIYRHAARRLRAVARRDAVCRGRAPTPACTISTPISPAFSAIPTASPAWSARPSS